MILGEVQFYQKKEIRLVVCTTPISRVITAVGNQRSRPLKSVQGKRACWRFDTREKKETDGENGQACMTERTVSMSSDKSDTFSSPRGTVNR